MKINKLNFNTGKEPFIYLNKNSQTVLDQGFDGGIRVQVIVGDKKIAGEVVIVDSPVVGKDEIGLSEIAFKRLGVENGVEAQIKHVPHLKSFEAIRRKMFGESFKEQEMYDIIQDIVDGFYSPSHIAAFCSVCEGNNMSEDEIAYLTKAMVETGNKINWDYDIVVDKHCIGGIPGNRTTNVAIPIVAAFGLHIPKTSSRAITSPSGTADTMEVFCNVDVPLERMKEIVEQEYGCIVWGGSVDLSPSDDLIINTKKLLHIDSEGQMVASILSKKIAAGSTHILIVIPAGPTAKVTEEKYKKLKYTFETIGKKLGVHVLVAHEDGSQPIGNGIGPVLEAIDVLKVLKDEPDAPQDLKEVSIQLAGEILEFSPDVKKGEGAKIAREILESGKAYAKFEAIIEAQGDVKNDIPTAKFKYDILAKKDGKVIEMDNKGIAQLCKLAGAPESTVAGVYLYKHLNDAVKNGEKLFTIHANSQGELDQALSLLKDREVIVIG